MFENITCRTRRRDYAKGGGGGAEACYRTQPSPQFDSTNKHSIW